LDARTTNVQVVVRSCEWAADESGNSSQEDGLFLPHRHERYARMARETEAASAASGRMQASTGGLLEFVDLDKLRCMSALLFFAEVVLSASALTLLVVCERNWIAVACLAPSHLIVLSIETYLARKDRAVVRYRQRLRRDAVRWKRIMFEILVVGGLGCCFFYTLVRARRYWKCKASRRTFLKELEAQDPARRDLADQARFDSHAMFVSCVPRVVTLVCMLASHHYTPVEEVVLLALLVVSLVVVVQGVVNFDYHASRHVRRHYALSRSLRFQAEHVLYRLSEVVGRVLVLVAGVLAYRVHPAGVAAFALVDYLFGVTALRWVSPASKKVWLLGIPLLVADVGRYADEDGFALPAHRLSGLLLMVRLMGLVAAVVVYAHFGNEANATGLPLEGAIAEQFLGLALIAHAVHFALGAFSQVGRVSDDLFTATLRGDAKAVVMLLDSNCDANVHACDPGLKTALHIAAHHGRFECARELFRHGADPNIQDAHGDNPLHVACRRGDLPIAELLLRRAGGPFATNVPPCDVHQRNHEGHTPLQVLKPGSPGALLVMLANVSQQRPEQTADSQGSTPCRGPPVEECQPDDLHELFGPLVGGEHYRFRAKPKVPAQLRAKGLTTFLFSKGVGEQLAEVLESMHERAAGTKVRLSTLRTVGTLGAGGFGKVIKVQDARTGELYAMKLQRKDRTTKCAVREAKALHMSNHAFIVRLVHIFHTHTFYGLLVELCEKDLNAAIVDDGLDAGLPLSKVARYTVCVMLALEYLHGQYIVFRDLKPENILITAEAAGDYAKLTDFGLARRVRMRDEAVDVADDELESHDDDSEGVVESSPPNACHKMYISPLAGTPGFMASEVLASSGAPAFPLWASSSGIFASISAPARSRGTSTGSLEELMRWESGRDWYALGCTMLLMLLGQRGGIRVCVEGRDVLLPPPEEDMLEVLTSAVSDGFISKDVHDLVVSLTAPRVVDRGDAHDMRAVFFLRSAVVELEAVVLWHRQNSSKSKLPKAAISDAGEGGRGRVL